MAWPITRKRDGRLPNLIYLAIAPEVLEIDGALIALEVANATDAHILPVPGAISKLDLKCYILGRIGMILTLSAVSRTRKNMRC